LYPGQFLKYNFVDHINRQMRPFRMYFDFFDERIVGQTEKETIQNSDRFREFLRMIIQKRRAELESSSDGPANSEDKGNFLTLLL